MQSLGTPHRLRQVVQNTVGVSFLTHMYDGNEKKQRRDLAGDHEARSSASITPRRDLGVARGQGGLKHRERVRMTTTRLYRQQRRSNHQQKSNSHQGKICNILAHFRGIKKHLKDQGATEKVIACMIVTEGRIETSRSEKAKKEKTQTEGTTNKISAQVRELTKDDANNFPHLPFIAALQKRSTANTQWQQK